MRTVPETIDQDWERFYTEFPDIYDRFAVTSPVVATKIDKLFGVRDRIVVDVGSGTGRSTFALAEKARLVIGVEGPPSPIRIESLPVGLGGCSSTLH